MVFHSGGVLWLCLVGIFQIYYERGSDGGKNTELQLYLCFLLIGQGVKNLSPVGEMGNVDGSLTSSGVLIHYICLGLATSVSKQYIQFSAAKLKLE